MTTTHIKKQRLGINIAILFSGIITLFYFYNGKIQAPGGCTHFFNWAENLFKFGQLNIHYVQRDVGYPLLIWLSGYSVTGDIKILLLFHFIFALSGPIIVYYTIRDYNKIFASIATVVFAASSLPINLSLFIHHDMFHIFLLNLGLYYFSQYIKTEKTNTLFLSTFFLFAASITRPVCKYYLFGLLLLAVLIKYIQKKQSKLAPICIALLISATLSASYAIYRNLIFTNKVFYDLPSYTGSQLFYGPYVNSHEFNVNLNNIHSPSIESIKKNIILLLQEDRQSFNTYILTGDLEKEEKERIIKLNNTEILLEMFKNPYSGYFHYFTARMFTNSNLNKDLIFAAKDICLHNPLMILSYCTRNMVHGLFNPSFGHPRWSTKFVQGGIYCFLSYSDEGADFTGLREPLKVTCEQINSHRGIFGSRDKVLITLDKAYKKYYRKCIYTLSVIGLINFAFIYFNFGNNNINQVFLLHQSNIWYHNFVVSLTAEPYDRYQQIWLISLYICCLITLINLFQYFKKHINKKYNKLEK
ncbi:MAG: hypothetical protein EBU90_17420 [Proteobacteria bacterium]|nr:hypothetical protein [Pseudomonadota bacterium]NBP15294.1 hypothetical protein [bacterium]